MARVVGHTVKNISHFLKFPMDQEKTWTVAGADLMNGVKTLYHFKRHGEGPGRPFIFDKSVPIEELYQFVLSAEFRDYFFECDKTVDKLNKAADEREAEAERLRLERKREREQAPVSTPKRARKR